MHVFFFFTLCLDFVFFKKDVLNIADGHESYLDHVEDMIEQDLRPIRPQPNSPESMQIYAEHRLVILNFQRCSNSIRFHFQFSFQMAAEFFELQKEIENAKNYKLELEEQLRQSELQMDEVAAKSDSEEAKKFVQLQKEKVIFVKIRLVN